MYAVGRALLLGAASMLAAVFLGDLAITELRMLVTASSPPTLDVLVGALAGAVVAGTLTWLGVCITLAAICESSDLGRRLLTPVTRALTPQVCRTAVRVVCGLAVVSGPAVAIPSAQATATPVGAPPSAAACPPSLVGLPAPDRPPRECGTDRRDSGSPSPAGTVPPATAPRDVTARTTTPRTVAPRTVVVRPGDSLWAIAEHRLGPDSDAADIAAAWPRWHAANRERIGPDPDLIHPGTRLVVPGNDRGGS